VTSLKKENSKVKTFIKSTSRSRNQEKNDKSSSNTLSIDQLKCPLAVARAMKHDCGDLHVQHSTNQNGLTLHHEDEEEEATDRMVMNDNKQHHGTDNACDDEGIVDSDMFEELLEQEGQDESDEEDELENEEGNVEHEDLDSGCDANEEDEALVQYLVDQMETIITPTGILNSETLEAFVNQYYNQHVRKAEEEQDHKDHYQLQE
jgi:hypothetical protein